MSKKYHELELYTADVSKEDVKDIMEKLIRPEEPLVEFLDLSWLFSLGFELVIKRYHNTVKLYIKEKRNGINTSLITFPFKLSDPLDIELEKGLMIPTPYLISKRNMFDFLTKANIKEIRLRMIRILGKIIGIGVATPFQGIRKPILVLDPPRFLEIDLNKYPSFYVEVLEPIPKLTYYGSKEALFEEHEIKIGLESFDVFQHGLIVGTSGSGKSKFIEMLVRAISVKYKDEARMVLIDPHSEFSKSLEDAYVVDYKKVFIDPLDVGQEKNPLIAQLITQLLMAALGKGNKYAERIIFFSVHLLLGLGKLSLENINKLLTDVSARTEFVSTSQDEEVKRFFDTEFQDIYMRNFNEAILPVVNFISEYLLYMKRDAKMVSLSKLLENNRIVVVSFDPHYFGKTMRRFLAGAIMNQMYILAITESLKKKTLLIVDEFSLVNAPVAREILSETRKFDFFLYLSAQYLNQIDKDIVDSMVTNVKNVVGFKVNKEDARFLIAMMDIKVEEFFRKKYSPSELEEKKKEMFVRLNKRECIIRLFDGHNYLMPMKVYTYDVNWWREYYKKIFPNAKKPDYEEKEQDDKKKKEEGKENIEREVEN